MNNDNQPSSVPPSDTPAHLTRVEEAKEIAPPLESSLDSTQDDSVVDCVINSPDLWRAIVPVPNKNSNKYSRGYVFILGGEFMTGASCLALRASQRIGAGIVVIACPKDAADVYRIVNISAIVKGFRDTAEFKSHLEDNRISALLVGPGLGDGAANAERVLSMIRLDKPIVMDADALNQISLSPEIFFEQIKQKNNTADQVLLTPHPGEFARLFPNLRALHPAQATVQAAAQSGCTIVFKAADSYIAHPDGRIWVSKNSPAWLATAGSGDVLSGICVGLMAQGITAHQAALIGHYIHAEAARRFGAGLIAQDLQNLIPAIYADLIAGQA